MPPLFASPRRRSSRDRGARRPTRTLAALGSLGSLAAIAVLGCGPDVGLVLTRENAPFIAIGVVDSLIQGRQNGDFASLPDLFGTVSPASAGAADETAPSFTCEVGSYFESEDGNRFDFDGCYAEGCVLDGGATYAVSGDGDTISITFDGFSGVCDDGRAVHLGSSVITCSGFLDLAPVCEVDFDTRSNFEFIGRHSGDPLEADGLEVERLDTGLYTFAGSLKYPGYGRVWFESITDVGFRDCPGDVPVSGEVEILGSIQGVRTNVMFLGCDWFSVCFDDGATAVDRCEAYLWRDIMTGPEEEEASP